MRYPIKEMGIMTKMRLISIVLLLLTVSLPAVASVGERTAPGSFVPSYVSTVDELCNVVEHNQVVAERYARHFGIPADTVVRYFKQNLRISYLKQGGTYRTYFITRHGQITSGNTYLLTGERVFVNPDGTPVLIARCGNPLTRVLPAVQSQNLGQAIGPIAQPELMVAVSPTPTTAVSAASVAMEPQVTEPVWQVAAEPEQELRTIPAALSLVPTKSSSSFLLPLLAGAGAAASSIDKSHPSVPVTPEPSSLLVLALGVPAVAGFARRRARR